MRAGAGVKAGEGMCPVCKVVPRATTKGGRRGYCTGCALREQSKIRHKKRPNKYLLGTWKQGKGDKKPPTDWREALRKAEEK